MRWGCDRRQGHICMGKRAMEEACGSGIGQCVRITVSLHEMLSSLPFGRRVVVQPAG